jgi:hypothetical protein
MSSSEHLWALRLLMGAGEMTQGLYAHMNNKKINKLNLKKDF